MANNKVIQITKDIFETEVLKSGKPVLVDFWADWCAPCRMLAPIIDQLADDFDGRAKIAKINIDDQPDLAKKYGVMTIPTVMVFKNGEILKTSVGAKPKSEFESLLNSFI